MKTLKTQLTDFSTWLMQTGYITEDVIDCVDPYIEHIENKKDYCSEMVRKRNLFEQWKKHIAPELLNECCEVYGTFPEQILAEKTRRSNFKIYNTKKLFYLTVLISEKNKYDESNFPKSLVCKYLNINHATGIYYEANYFPNSPLKYNIHFNQQVSEMRLFYQELKHKLGYETN